MPGLEAAKPFIKVLCDSQSDLADRAAKAPVEIPRFVAFEQDAFDAVKDYAETRLAEIFSIADKQEREAASDEYHREVVDALAGEGKPYEDRQDEIVKAYGAVTRHIVRQRVLTEQVRIDGRGLTDIRQLTAEVEVLPRVHGSAIFERGETQIMGVTTLNMLKMEQQLDSLSPETSKRYMHHYTRRTR